MAAEINVKNAGDQIQADQVEKAVYPTLSSGTIWHWLFGAIVAGAVLMLCAGCQFPSAAELQAISKDHADVSVDITSVWATFHFHRANPFVFGPSTQPSTQPTKP